MHCRLLTAVDNRSLTQELQSSGLGRVGDLCGHFCHQTLVLSACLASGDGGTNLASLPSRTPTLNHHAIPSKMLFHGSIPPHQPFFPSHFGRVTRDPERPRKGRCGQAELMWPLSNPSWQALGQVGTKNLIRNSSPPLLRGWSLPGCLSTQQDPTICVLVP